MTGKICNQCDRLSDKVWKGCRYCWYLNLWVYPDSIACDYLDDNKAF